MATTATILTAEEFAEIRSEISRGWEKDRAKIEKCLLLAETVDLAEQLGGFYFDVIENTSSEEWAELFSGDGVRVGLKQYLASLAYVRYLSLVNATHTPHGYVSKTGQNSEPISFDQIRAEKKDEQRAAAFWFKTIDNYLRSNPDLFPNYKPNKKTLSSFNNVKTSTLR